MPFFHNQGRADLRRMYLDAWRKHCQAQPMEPMEDQIVQVVELHPEYTGLLESGDDALDRDYTPEGGRENPFLHMSLHLAVREQVATNRPAGIAAVYESLVRKLGDAHEAEHAVIECLATTLWEAQRAGVAPDEQAYLEALRSRV
jgi:hypothetical protein